MAQIEVMGAIKLEPSVIKSEPSAVIEIHPFDVFQSSDEEDNVNKNDKRECEIAIDEVNDEDGSDCKDNNFLSIENLREDERLVLNFNRPVIPQSHDVGSKENSNTEKVDWAKIYRTREETNCLEEERKVKKVYGSSWKKPIQEEEYTCMSKTSFICNYCHREFKGQKSLALHIRVVHRESSIIQLCPYCPKQSKRSLKSHILTTHKNENEVNWFQCHECGRKFHTKSHLARHIHETHLGKRGERKDTSCPACDRVFISKYLMRNHVRKDHERKYQCEKCSFTGQSFVALKNHVEVYHTDLNDLPIYRCSKCDFKTRYKHCYYTHCKKHENTYFCDKCAFVTYTLGKLKLHANVHKKKIDDETLKYHCKKCDYKTYRKYSLQVHELNHLKPEEINYFYCYHCNFKANRKDNLKNHIRRHFKKEEVTLQCFICDFETKKRGALTNHINGHRKSPQINEE